MAGYKAPIFWILGSCSQHKQSQWYPCCSCDGCTAVMLLWTGQQQTRQLNKAPKTAGCSGHAAGSGDPAQAGWWGVCAALNTAVRHTCGTAVQLYSRINAKRSRHVLQ
jgi:hypothetical protein